MIKYSSKVCNRFFALIPTLRKWGFLQAIINNTMSERNPAQRQEKGANLINLAFLTFQDLTSDNGDLQKLNHPAALAHLNTLRHAVNSIRRGVDASTVSQWLSNNGFGQNHIEYVLEIGSQQ